MHRAVAQNAGVGQVIHSALHFHGGVALQHMKLHIAVFVPGAVFHHGHMVGVAVAVPGEKHPVPRLGNIAAGDDEAVLIPQPLVAPALQVAPADDVAPLADKPVPAGIAAGVEGIHLPQQLRAVLLINLIHAPA